MRHKVIKLQLLIGLTLVVLVSVFSQDINKAVSASVGFSLAYIPTIIYSKIAFARGMVVLPNVALLQHQKAMVARFVLNLLLFGFVLLLYRQCNFVILFSVYFITLSAYWLSLLYK